jgi:hypothetical protein
MDFWARGATIPWIDPEGVKERTENKNEKRREKYIIYKVCQPSMSVIST